VITLDWTPLGDGEYRAMGYRLSKLDIAGQRFTLTYPDGSTHKGSLPECKDLAQIDANRAWEGV